MSKSTMPSVFKILSRDAISNSILWFLAITDSLFLFFFKTFIFDYIKIFPGNSLQRFLNESSPALVIGVTINLVALVTLVARVTRLRGLHHEGSLVEGIITEYRPGFGESPTIYRFEYQYLGRKFRNSRWITWCRKRMTEGQTVSIIVDTKNPMRSDLIEVYR